MPSNMAAAETPLPGISGEDFDRALREDRLAIVPVDLPGLPNGALPLSLSPDGKKLLFRAWNEDLLSDGHTLNVYTIADGSILPLSLNTGRSNQPMETITKLFEKPEANAVSWSADGQYLSFSFPRSILMNMYYTTNIWMADLQTGVVDPLFELPERIEPFGGDIPNIPVRAMFDAERPILYYDLMIMDKTDADERLKVRLYGWNYETGSTAFVGDVPFYMMTTDPTLRRMGEYLVTTVTSMRVADGTGLAAMAGGKAAKLTLKTEGFFVEFLYGSRLIDTHGNAALLNRLNRDSIRLIESIGRETREILSSARLMECALDENGSALYGALLVGLDCQLPPESRLLRFTVEEVKALDDETANALCQRVIQKEIIPVHNAAFSPDGGYYLLASQSNDSDVIEPRGTLYVWNRTANECGLVTLPDDLLMNNIAFYGEAPMNFFARGIQWSEDGLLLLFTGETNSLFRLDIGP